MLSKAASIFCTIWFLRFTVFFEILCKLSCNQLVQKFNFCVMKISIEPVAYITNSRSEPLMIIGVRSSLQLRWQIICPRKHSPASNNSRILKSYFILIKLTRKMLFIQEGQEAIPTSRWQGSLHNAKKIARIKSDCVQLNCLSIKAGPSL